MVLEGFIKIPVAIRFWRHRMCCPCPFLGDLSQALPRMEDAGKGWWVTMWQASEPCLETEGKSELWQLPLPRGPWLSCPHGRSSGWQQSGPACSVCGGVGSVGVSTGCNYVVFTWCCWLTLIVGIARFLQGKRLFCRLGRFLLPCSGVSDLQDVMERNKAGDGYVVLKTWSSAALQWLSQTACAHWQCVESW